MNPEQLELIKTKIPEGFLNKEIVILEPLGESGFKMYSKVYSNINTFELTKEQLKDFCDHINNLFKYNVFKEMVNICHMKLAVLSERKRIMVFVYLKTNQDISGR